jgi:predicted RNA-binding Zn-ribbon protein involved in translation (DUF1610 family)
MTKRVVIGVYKGEPILDHEDMNTEIKCPDCGVMAGEQYEDHPLNYVCLACGYEWTDGMDDWREDR